MSNARQAQHPIASSFTARWSPRAFDGQPLSEARMRSLFEAARWAPSAYNFQPWRF
ncbi:MAG: nitroreductase family protein, partial [Pseudomonadaceae bacterium]